MFDNGNDACWGGHFCVKPCILCVEPYFFVSNECYYYS